MNKIIICLNCLNLSNETIFLKNKTSPYTSRCEHCSHDKSLVKLDKRIAPIILKLREKGYNPQFSCSGHKISLFEYKSPYLVIHDDKDLNLDFLRNNKKIILEPFREGISIRLNINNKFSSQYFIKILEEWISTLKDKNNKRLILWEDDNTTFNPNNYKGKVIVLCGKERSKKFLKDKNINKISSFNLSHKKIFNKTKKESQYLYVNDLKKSFYLLNDLYLKNDLYVILPLKRRYENKNNPFYIWEGSSYFNNKEYNLAVSISKLLSDGNLYAYTEDKEIVPI